MSTRQFPLLTSALLLALTTATAVANDPDKDKTTTQTEPPVQTLEPAELSPPVDTTDSATAQTDDLTDTSDNDQLDPSYDERAKSLDPATDVDTDDVAADDDMIVKTDDDAATDEPDVAGDDVAGTDNDEMHGDEGDPLTDPDADVDADDIARAEDDMTDEIAAESDIADPVDHTDTATMTTPQVEPPLPGRTGAQLAKATRELRDLDGNGDGSLTADEVPDSLALSDRFADYDIDDDNLISLNEYQSWMAAQDIGTDTDSEQRMAEDNNE